MLNKNKKILKEIKKEKEELLFIKKELENTSPKIDITNLYTWRKNGIIYIVRLDVKKVKGTNWGKVEEKYESTITNIFSKEIIYKQTSKNAMRGHQYMGCGTYLYPIHQIDENLYAFTNNLVPIYILKQLYYNLNHIDTKKYILKNDNK